jgi:hypothetical protein
MMLGQSDVTHACVRKFSLDDFPEHRPFDVPFWEKHKTRSIEEISNTIMCDDMHDSSPSKRKSSATTLPPFSSSMQIRKSLHTSVHQYVFHCQK